MVHDLESFHVFQRDITSRLATGRRLLDELSTACETAESIKTTKTPAAGDDDCSTLRAVIDRIAAELGDAVLKRIKADPQLAAALQQKRVVKVEAEQVNVKKPKEKEEEEAEEAIGAKPLKNPQKRRRSGLPVSLFALPFCTGRLIYLISVFKMNFLLWDTHSLACVVESLIGLFHHHRLHDHGSRLASRRRR